MWKEFLPGNTYYWEIKILKGKLIKIGVCRTHVKTSEAFSDTMDGWAIYDGQLRHNSNSSGKKYGTKLKEGDVIGVMLDMIKVCSL